MTITIAHYLVVAACLFTLGILGIFLNRKNVIVIRRPPPRTSRERTRMAAIRGLYPVLAGKDPGSPPRFKARLDREGGIRGLCTP